MQFFKSLLAVIPLLSHVTLATSLHEEDVFFSHLLKRQDPGSPSYACHANCGAAISGARQANYCTNQTWVTAYNACIACAGPNDQNIWSMYGTSVARGAAACGLTAVPSGVVAPTASGNSTISMTSTGPITSSSRAANATGEAVTTSTSRGANCGPLATSATTTSSIMTGRTTRSASGTAATATTNAGVAITVPASIVSALILAAAVAIAM